MINKKSVKPKSKIVFAPVKAAAINQIVFQDKLQVTA